MMTCTVRGCGAGDKAHSMVSDNSKLRSAIRNCAVPFETAQCRLKLRSAVPGYRAEIPFEQGAREIVACYDEDPGRQRADQRLDAVMDKLVEPYRR
jgi:hypothetical protein